MSKKTSPLYDIIVMNITENKQPLCDNWGLLNESQLGIFQTISCMPLQGSLG